MAHVTAEMTQAVRKALKTKFPDVKWSVSKDGSAIYIRILESKINLTADTKNEYDDGYAQINQYYLEDYQQGAFYKEVLDTMKEATASVGREYFDHSDIQSDYFHCAYYYYLSVGAYDKPYKHKQNS